VELDATRNMIERFPDPAVLRVGDTYYAYATRQGPLNIQVVTSKDLVYWSEPRNALPAVPDWAQVRTWAPAVVQRGTTFVMWYTTRDRASARQCISVATAADPLGPFIDRSSAPAICQVDRGGSIDPEVFVDADGASYLHWKSEDNALGQPTSLWAARLNADATVAGTPVPLLTASPGWQGRLVEGPAMALDAGRYYLFYGANAWNTAAAAIGYAQCAGPLGPCLDRSQAAPWVASEQRFVGPSGPHVFRDADGALRVAYHAWDGCVGPPPCNRATILRRLAFTEAGPRILGDR
jgi:beta-xylosidase